MFSKLLKENVDINTKERKKNAKLLFLWVGEEEGRGLSHRKIPCLAFWTTERNTCLMKSCCENDRSVNIPNIKLAMQVALWSMGRPLFCTVKFFLSMSYSETANAYLKTWALLKVLIQCHAFLWRNKAKPMQNNKKKNEKQKNKQELHLFTPS